MAEADAALPSKEEMQQAQHTLKLLQRVISQIEAAPEPPQDLGNGESDAAATEEGATGDAAPSKKRVAVFLAYNGHGFSGMQLNPGVPTIEASLRDALVATGAIPEDQQHHLAAARWSRSARTDKGVSALGQVVSAKLATTPDLPQRMRKHLPAKIKILGIKKVTASFDARTHCDSRVYEYCLPEWCFDPDCFPSRPGWRPPAYPADAAIAHTQQSANTGPNGTAVTTEKGTVKLTLRKGYSDALPPQGSTFEFDDDCCARLNGFLSQYASCHNFHNFSPGVQPEQMSAQRNILSFRCHGAFTISSRTNAARWVRMRVHGQSFLLNQIRKMVGLAVACYRGTAPEDAVEMALDPCRDFSTPMAPELGLFLCECKYAAYNERFGKEREVLDIAEWAGEVEAFKQEQIYPAMLARDDVEAVNYQWLRSVTDKAFLFSSWHTALPMRKLKRPRKRSADQLAENAS